MIYLYRFLRRQKIKDDNNPNTATKLTRAATELFASKGFKGSSIRDIAKMTGMTISNIYYHYNSKEGLLFSVLKSTTESLIAELQKVSQLDIDPLDRFKLLLKTHLTYHANHMKEGKIFGIDEEQLSPEYMEMNKQYQKDIFAIYFKELTNLETMAIVNCKYLTVTLFSLFGAINSLLRWYRPDGPLPLDQIIDDIVTFILHGVSGPPKRSRS